MSGLSVALLALPQAMAYALIAKVPIQAGILAVIIGTFITSCFGYCKHLMSGPTNATALLIQGGASYIFYKHFQGQVGLSTAQITLGLISQIVLLMGLIQIFIALLKLGSFTRFISRSVMMGYILGVTCSIWMGQLFHFLHIARPTGQFALYEYFPYLFRSLHHIDYFSLSIGICSLVLLGFLKKKAPGLPRALIMIGTTSLVLFALSQFMGFKPAQKMAFVQSPPISLQNLFFVPKLLFNTSLLKDLVIVAFAMAFFSIFEVNSISRLISAKSAQPLKVNRDIFGVGLSNLISSFFLGTLPSSGSPSRTTLNYQSGGISRLSGVFSSLGVLLLLGAFYPFIAYIPVVSLAALLMIIGYEIIDFELLKICFRATKRDALVLSVTFISCLFFQLDIALFIGIALSVISYLRLAAQTDIHEYIFTESGHFKPIRKNEERSDERIRIYSMEGNLFFGSVDSIQKKLHTIVNDPEVRILILRFSHVHHLDASICCFLEVFAQHLKKQGKSLYLCEMIESTTQVVNESPLLKKLGQEYLYEKDPHSPYKATQMAFAHALEKLNQESNKAKKDLNP